jgi:hypothetical protein
MARFRLTHLAPQLAAMHHAAGLTLYVWTMDYVSAVES